MIENYIAIDNVCAWPNLNKLPNGELVVFVFNNPSHGIYQGHIECWASTDNGRIWRLRSVPAPHDPGTNRMNISAGLRADGALIVLCSGLANRPADGEPKTQGVLTDVLPVWVSISTDNGHTWQIIKEGFPETPDEGLSKLIPFGHIQTADNGDLCSVVYAMQVTDPKARSSAYLTRSKDGGRTWAKPTIIAPNWYNETEPLHLGNGRWLAACRTLGRRELHLFISTDDGHTWTPRGPLALTQQHPAAFLKMADGRVMLCYGNRGPGHHGIDVRVSSDQGESWDNILQIIKLPHGDVGYPSTAQIGPDQFVTAYYSATAVCHSRYHMGVQIWGFEDFYGKKKP